MFMFDLYIIYCLINIFQDIYLINFTTLVIIDVINNILSYGKQIESSRRAHTMSLVANESI